MPLYLLRHGQAAAGAEDLDPGLSEMGHAQARAAASWLRDKNVGRLVVSPLRRCRETAEPIAAALGLLPEVREEVAEVFDSAMPATERMQMIGPFMAGTWAEQPEGLRAWRRRVTAAVLGFTLDAAAAGHDVVVVSHYIAIGVAIGAALGDDRVVPAAMANASITQLEGKDGRLTLLEAVSVAHLAPEQVTGLGSAIAGRG
ncbi:MAG: histidine phosphatase family protein [Tepidiformaceae bacterium]